MVELAAVELFAGLRPVELARLAGELEELTVPAGASVFQTGEPGDRLYVVRSGLAEVRAGSASEAEPIGLYEPGASFGEAALLTEDPRSSTVIALTDLELWALPKERFLELVRQVPALALAVGRTVSRRLQATHQAISALSPAFRTEAERHFSSLDPELQRFLRLSAPLDPVRADVIGAALGRPDAQQVLVYLAARLPFVLPAGDVQFRYHPLFRQHLIEKLTLESGPQEARRWRRRLSEQALTLGHPDVAVRLLADIEELDEATKVLEEAVRVALRDESPSRAAELLRTAPISVLEQPRLLEQRIELAVRQDDLSQAVALLERHLERLSGEAADRDLGSLERPRRRLAELYLRLGRSQDAARLLREEADPEQGPAGEPSAQLLPVGERAVERGVLLFAAASGLRRVTANAGALGGLGQSRPLGLLLSAATLLAFLLLPPPPGLSHSGWLALGILTAALPLLIFSVLADHYIALLMIVGWAGLGLVSPKVALAGFATSGWILVLSVLAVGVALSRCGLLYRVVLAIVRRAPAQHTGLTLSLALAGVMFTPAMPNATARTALAAPIVQELAATLGYGRRSAGSAALALTALLGFGQMCGLFLTGSSSGLLVHTLLPAASRERFGFIGWFLAALPLHLVIFALTYAAILLLFRPRPATQRSHGRLEAQRRALGPMQRSERIAAVVFALLLVAFVSGPAFGVEPAWSATLAMVALAAAGVLDTQGFRAGVNWSFLLFFGAMLSLAEVFSTLGVDTWLATAAAAPLTPLATNPTLFLIALGLGGFLVNLLVRWQAACLLMTLVLVPATAPLGFEPWVIGMTALVTTNMWFLPYQSTIYQALYFGSEEQAFGHSQARPIAAIYGLSCLLGLAASVPIWSAMGLLP